VVHKYLTTRDDKLIPLQIIADTKTGELVSVSHSEKPADEKYTSQAKYIFSTRNSNNYQSFYSKQVTAFYNRASRAIEEKEQSFKAANRESQQLWTAPCPKIRQSTKRKTEEKVTNMVYN
jgi:hypothetical protein